MPRTFIIKITSIRRTATHMMRLDAARWAARAPHFLTAALAADPARVDAAFDAMVLS